MTSIDLNPDHAHDPARTRLLSDTAVGITRALTYATAPGRGGIESVTDVHDLIGNLVAAIAALPQVYRQLSTWLFIENVNERLNETSDGRYQGDTDRAIEHAKSVLATAMVTTDQLEAQLRTAHNLIGHIEHVEHVGQA